MSSLIIHVGLITGLSLGVILVVLNTGRLKKERSLEEKVIKDLSREIQLLKIELKKYKDLLNKY